MAKVIIFLLFGKKKNGKCDEERNMLPPEDGRHANDEGMDYSQTYGQEKETEGRNQCSATQCAVRQDSSVALL